MNSIAGKLSDAPRAHLALQKRLQTMTTAELEGLLPALLVTALDRLAAVEQMSDGIGWGFHDFISEVVGRLEEAEE